jgi:hypothetical protein
VHEYRPQQAWDAVPPVWYPAPGRPVPGPEGGWLPEPDRPGTATAAAVLGFVTAGLTLLMDVLFIAARAAGADDGPSGILLFGIPAAAGLVVGGVRLLGGHSSAPLFGSALAAIGVLALSWLVGLGTLPRHDAVALTVFVVLALPLPVLTAVFAWTPTVRRWTAGED